MKTSFKALIALSAIAFSGVAFAQSTDAAATSKDPFVQNRTEKAQAKSEYKAEYKKEKAEAKHVYKKQKAAANKKLKATGERSDTEKNLEVPK